MLKVVHELTYFWDLSQRIRRRIVSFVTGRKNAAEWIAV